MRGDESNPDLLPEESPFSPLAPDRVILTNDTAIAFYDAFPLSKGHALVVPLMPVISLAELDPEIQAEVWETVRQTRELLEEQYAPDGFNIGVNDGKAAGQTVPHAHVHVIPRYDGDVPDPRGGIRWVIPERAVYWADKKLVTAAILRRGTTVLLTRRADGEKLAGYWEFPGGKQEEGESLRECLEREIMEELGFRVKANRALLKIDHDYGFKSISLHIFECQHLSGEPRALQCQEIRWEDPSRLDGLAFSPPDMKVVQYLSLTTGQ